MVVVDLNTKQKSSPDTVDEFFKVMAPKFEQISVVLSGARALRKAGVKYTPKFSSETDEGYTARLKKTHLTNILKDSVLNTVARPFSKELKIEESESAPEYVEWAENIDRNGTNINEFSKNSFKSGVSYGETYILVDYPTIEGPLTKAQAADRDVRPYFVHVRAKQVLSYREANVKGRVQCVYFKFLTHDYDYDEDNNEVKVRRVTEIKAPRDGDMETGFFKVHESRDGKDWEVVKEGYYPFDAVTVVRFCVSDEDEEDGTHVPPFLDLCEANIAHWNSRSDQTNILTRSRFAIYHMKGMEPSRDDDGVIQQVELGPDSIIYSDLDAAAAGAEIQTVTLPTEGLEHGWTDLDRMVEEMRIMGLDPLISKSASSTATGDAITDEKSNSALGTWALEFAECLEKAFKYAGAWHSITDADKIKVVINLRFGVTNKEINEINTFQHMHSLGQLSLKTLLRECQNRQMFGPEFSIDDELTEIQSERDEFSAGYDLEMGNGATHKKLPDQKGSERYAKTVNGPSVM